MSAIAELKRKLSSGTTMELTVHPISEKFALTQPPHPVKILGVDLAGNLRYLETGHAAPHIVPIEKGWVQVCKGGFDTLIKVNGQPTPYQSFRFIPKA